MSLQELLRLSERETPIVLVLQENQAFWFRQKDQADLEDFIETIEPGPLNLQSYCPWIEVAADSMLPRIHLVLDSTLDEVDRVKVLELAQGWMRRWQCSRMSRRLRTEYPLANIHPLPLYTAPDALSVVHHLLPELWQPWLQALQENQITISYVVTGLELLCGYSALAIKSKPRAMLFDVPIGNNSRHLLVDEGAPLFMRVVSGVAGEGMSFRHDVDALHQSLEHIRKNIAGPECPPIILQAETGDQLDEGCAYVPKLFASLCLGEAIDLRRVAADPALTAEASPGLADSSADDSQQAWKPIRWQGISTVKSWKLSAKHRLAGGVLKASVNRNRLHSRIQLLQKVTILCAWISAAIVAAASVYGVVSARERLRLGAEKHAVVEQVEQLSSVLSSLSDDAAFIVQSMDRIDTHSRVKPIDAGMVLSTVAEAITDFPALILDDLSWTVLSDEKRLDSTFTSLDQVSDRQRLWLEDAPLARLQIELGGKVLSVQGLREQQQILDEFTAYLDSMPGVSDVTVLESPVNVARSSDQLGKGESSYRLVMLLGVS